MRFPILTSSAVLASACHVQAKAVFAHFMVGNTGRYSTATWRDDIRLAQEAHIDGFALNIAYGERMNAGSLENVFEVASEMGFKLIFSFDYAGGGPWPKDDVLNLLKQYATRPEYFKHSDGTPLVSTFEGPEQAADWVDIKRSFPCFFMPDWSSKGAKRAAELAGGVADGLFNWAAWPWGNTNMDTYVDASYYQYLRVDEDNSKPYMMPASPWFYTNLPGYKKNWLWRGDDLWHDRWIQIVYNQPDYVEIISWNDYGESHHIGPLRPNAMEAFVTGRAPFNFARDMPHDGWRMTLPFWIDYYKNGKATVTQEGIMGWFRTTPAAKCSDGETSGNTASQLQLEFSPAEVMQDRIFFSAVLGSHADVTVNVGGTSQAGTWTSVPDGGIGVYHGSVPFQGRGSVTISLQRGGANIATIDGGSITDNCAERGLTNWNAWVGSAMAAGSISATPALSRSEQTCIKGTGATGFTKLCEFTCKYGYCPVSACQCVAIGAPIPEPPTTGPAGFPAAGKSESYTGLCGWSCPRGFCPTESCSTSKQPIKNPTVSEFLPPACTGGGSDNGLKGLCQYACNFGFCPRGVCTCSNKGGLNEPPPIKDTTGDAVNEVKDFGLCQFACSRGYCPSDACRLDYPIPDEGDRCDVRDNTWLERTMPDVQHAMYPMPTSTIHYITIVNLTPYTFRYLKDRSNYYQVAADFDDIPPGQSRQNKARWATSGTSRSDDNGEAYFEVKGTNHEFRIRCTTHYPSDMPIRFVVDLDSWGLGVKEYEVPETEVSITFVITGSENYGYHHSLTLDSSPVAWMDSIKEHIKGRLVKHVIMPGAHDAGMSVIGKYQWGGTSKDTQTQAYGIAKQLELGARYFDLRPAIADGEFHIFHVTDPRATVILGASGVTLQNVIHDINDFYISHPGEVVFLWMRDMVSFRGGLFGGGHPFDGDEMAQFFDKLRGIRNRCRGLTEATKLQERVMGELMEQNDGSGCVAIILDQFGVDPRIPQDDPASGIFLAGKHMDRTDRWEEDVGTTPAQLLGYQVAGFDDPVRRRLEPSKGGDFFVSQWVLNARHEDAVFWGVENLANYLTTPMLYYGGVAEMTPEMFPTVMLMDYIGVRVSGDTTAYNQAAELRTLALGLNLYMVSENCYVSKRRNPLVKKSGKRLAAPWNGIIFANGTRIDSPPPNFDPWRVDVLKSGTVFGNGTVLTRNITNPF
ncbi:Mutanase [Colletotrichum siamense]|nr:Mutanase [Colletotrichum siamense]